MEESVERERATDEAERKRAIEWGARRERLALDIEEMLREGLDIKSVRAEIESEVGGKHDAETETLRGEVRRGRLLHGSVRPNDPLLLAC